MAEDIDGSAPHGVESRFAGGYALVTGAGGGIGCSIAVALSGLGLTVALVGRGRAALEATADAVPGPSHVLPTDITRDDDVAALASTARELFDGRLDLLVHCAGVYGRGALEEAPVAELDRMYRANTRAPYVVTQHLLQMLTRSAGQVVFVLSTQALVASGEVGQFAATQQAQKAVAESLREEVNSRGVRVLSLFVGRTATARQEKIFASEGREYRPELLLQPTDVARTIACCVSLPSTAEITSVSIRPARKSY